VKVLPEQTMDQFFIDQIVVPKKLLENYKTIGLDERELIVLLQIIRFLHDGIDFPTPAHIAQSLTFTENECVDILRQLMQKEIVHLEEVNNDEGRLSEKYSLQPLWDKLYRKSTEKENNIEEGELFIRFEQEFARPLTPLEIETINAWLDEDKLSPALIIAALREAVLMNTLNFKYIDRILHEWKRKGIRSVDDARRESESFRSRKINKNYETVERDTSVYFNWLEEDIE